MRDVKPITDALLDRLVDGELSPDEERQLLRSLHSSPGEWRRCALAFVEAAAWRRELAGLSRDDMWGVKRPHKVPDAVAAPSAAVKPFALRSRGRNFHFYPAVAASILIAFAAGWLLPQAWRTNDTTFNVVALPGSVAPSAPRGPSGDLESRWPDVLDPSQVMSLVVTQPDGSVRPVLVPLLDENDASRLAGGITEAGIHPALPSAVRRQLEDAGYSVQQRRRYAPLPLESGRRLIVPVEDTHIVPVRAGVY